VALAELRHATWQAAGVLIATPGYSGCIPGQLKNALDWAVLTLRINAVDNCQQNVAGPFGRYAHGGTLNRAPGYDPASRFAAPIARNVARSAAPGSGKDRFDDSGIRAAVWQTRSTCGNALPDPLAKIDSTN
jgi:NADPH-dependent FMN reductase